MKSKASLRFEEVFRNDDFVSTQYLIYTDYAGAAHAGWWTKTKNFFGADLGKLEIGDLFMMNSEVLEYITEYVVLDLRRQEGQDLRTPPESPLKELLEIVHSRSTRTDLWNLYSQYNFDLEKITFNFSPATIPGYGWAADRIVRVPWDGLTGYLDVRLKEGPIGTLLSARKAAGRAPP
jgi:hypothetical protein